MYDLYKRHEKLSYHLPTISRIQKHCTIILDTSLCFFFHISCLWICHIQRVYDGLIFHLLSVIVLEDISSDLFCLMFISYLAYRIGPVKIPLFFTLFIVGHLTHYCQLHLPRAWHSHAQKQANKCPKKFNVYFPFSFCLGNKIQTV